MKRFFSRKRLLLIIAAILVCYELFSLLLTSLSSPFNSFVFTRPLGAGYYRTFFVIYTIRTEGGFLFNSYHFERVEGANPFTFHVLEDGFAADNRYVYCGRRIEGVDPKQLVSLGNHYYFDGTNVRHYCNIQKKRMGHGTATEAFDPATFEPLHCGIVKDKTGVYQYEGGSTEESEGPKGAWYNLRVDALDRIDIADPETIVITQQCDAWDKNHQYTIRGNVSGFRLADTPDSTIGAQDELLGCFYRRTTAGIFWLTTLLPDADSGTFITLQPKAGNDCGWSGGYARDSTHIYYGAHTMVGADPDTFTVIDTVWPYYAAYDKNNQYIAGNPTSKFASDEKTFRTYMDIVQFQKDHANIASVSAQSVEINVQICGTETYPEQNYGTWPIGANVIHINGLQADRCLMKIRNFNTGSNIPSYECAIPTALQRVRIDYDFQRSMQNPSEALVYSFDRNAYCSRSQL